MRDFLPSLLGGSAVVERRGASGYARWVRLRHVQMDDALRSPHVLDAGRGIAPRASRRWSRCADRTACSRRIHGDTALESRGTLDLPGMQLEAVSVPTSEFTAGPRYGLAWAALAAGLVVTVLAAAYFSMLSRRLWAHQQLETEHDRLFTLSPDLLCISGFDGRFREINPQWNEHWLFAR